MKQDFSEICLDEGKNYIFKLSNRIRVYFLQGSVVIYSHDSCF